MDRATPSPESPAPRDPATQSGPDPHARAPQATPGQPDLIVATAFVQTTRHFFPDLNDWLQVVCGAVLQIAKDNAWSYVLTFKQGRLPSVWAEFQRLKELCPENVREIQLPDGTRQVFRWVHDLSYEDDQKRRWTFHALDCTETSPLGEKHYFAWITGLFVTKTNAAHIAEKGGRARWKIENEAFNRQKNHGPNLEHAYSLDPEKWKAYYYLLQIAFLITQLVERGSLLRQLAAELHRTPQQLFGSLANIVHRLREILRWLHWPDDCFDEETARCRRIGLVNTS